MLNKYTVCLFIKLVILSDGTEILLKYNIFLLMYMRDKPKQLTSLL